MYSSYLKHIRVVTTLLLLSVFSITTSAKCLIYYHEKPLSKDKSDAVSTLLTKEKFCPKSIQHFKHLLLNNGLQVKTSMVANRGRNNPKLGSFSFFESIKGTMPSGFTVRTGEFFLGYFTTVDNNLIKLDQRPQNNKLLIELIAWDKNLKLFNFYELRGLNNSKTRWYYRGNSKDALLDNKYLYRRPPSKKKNFGARMRCSACHNSGGPIMKELKSPHNDWWSSSRRLPLFPNLPDEDTNSLLKYLVEANSFANDVQLGINKINKSNAYNKIKKSLSLQEQLRPLFCTTEINIESSKSQGKMEPIRIPSGFWLNPLLGQLKISLSPQKYEDLLIKNQMKFPETSLFDADHRWLTPVKGINNINSIKQLIKSKMITKHFAESVLMIYFKHPVFSNDRCELLKLIPSHASNRWRNAFISHLYLEQAQFKAALVLAKYLNQKKLYNHHYFMKLVANYKEAIKVSTLSEKGSLDSFDKLIKTRQEVIDNELSKNPLGQILEPGFRVIFPVPRK